ncbi:MAG TPA: hypothetical protein VF428_09260 [Casimicrobiaceae bacterium]
MTTPSERLAEANACHDDDVPRGAELLRSIDPEALAANETRTYAFLINHVLGEKLGCWAEALKCQRRNLERPERLPVLWRQLGAAASALGDTAVLDEAVSAYAIANEVDAARARDIIQLNAAMCLAPSSAAAEAAARTLAAITPLTEVAWQPESPLDGAAAMCLNNLASGLQDRPLPDLRHAALRTAVERCAGLAHVFWKRAGTWVNVERALYLQAMVGNALGDADAARRFASEALAILDANDADHAEDVDRAFIELERAHACKQLGLNDEAAVAQGNAQAIAGAFSDASLSRWYESRSARLATLPA